MEFGYVKGEGQGGLAGFKDRLRNAGVVMRGLHDVKNRNINHATVTCFLRGPWIRSYYFNYSLLHDSL